MSVGPLCGKGNNDAITRCHKYMSMQVQAQRVLYFFGICYTSQGTDIDSKSAYVN